MNNSLKTILIIMGAVCALLIAFAVIFALVYLPIMRENNKMALEKQKQEQETQKEKEQAEKDKTDEAFANNLKCQDLLTDLKKRWNNVVGIYYRAPEKGVLFEAIGMSQGTCIVKYTKNGKIEEAPIEGMQDDKTI